VAVYTIINLTEKRQYPDDPLNLPRFDLNSGGVGYGPLNSAVPQDVLPVLNQYIQEIRSEQLVPPETIQQPTTR